MKLTTKLILLFLFVFTFQNCQDENFDSQDNNPGLETNDLTFQSENFGNTTTGNFVGLIKNEAGEKLSNVQITIGNTITSTDRNGLFILNNVDVFENFAYIKAYKDGYTKGSRVVIPKTDGVNRIDITLFKKDITAVINSGESSIVSGSNGEKVNFIGDFIDENGNPYSGQVEVVLDYIRPNSTLTFTKMPGSLFAQTSSNDATSLETYGMVSVNLFSPSGETLNIDENSPAIIEFPVDFTQTDVAPETIALWYFDEIVGYWKEQGEATREGDTYIAEVSHFTWWNCDIPFDAVNLCFSITSNASEAFTPYYALIKRNSTDQVIYSGIVLSRNGEECGLIPINEEITISIYSAANECNNLLVHEEVLGGYSSDTTADISFSEDLQTTTITGAVTNCNGMPLTNGYAFIDEFNSYSITNGIISIGMQHCTTTTVQVQIFDFETSQWTVSNDIALNGETINLGTLNTCDDIGGIYNENVTLNNQDEVNLFGMFNYTTINGNLLIGRNDSNSTDIVDLSPLENLTSISGSVTITNNGDLQSFAGLQNLETIDGSLNITFNSEIQSISNLDNLDTIGGLIISNNENLNSLQGMTSLSNINGRLGIVSNPLLNSLEGFESITTLQSLSIKNNQLLESLEPLESLTNVGLIEIENNDTLINLIGLEQITELDFIWVASNENLTSLTGLENLTSINSNSFLISLGIGIALEFDIFVNGPNPNLTDLCALENLFVNGNGLSLQETVVVIANNAYNPTPQDIIDGNCSQ